MSGSRSSAGLAMVALSDAGWRRLVAYCRRERFTERELVERCGRNVVYVGSRLVWADTEVRDVLPAAGDDRAAWNELADLVEARGESAFSLLDIATAMSLEAGLVDWRGGPP